MNKVMCETQSGEKVSIDARHIVQRIAVYGIYKQNGRVLVVKTHSNKWELPGGTPEAGESLKEALKRELREETGYVITPGEVVYTRESFYASPSGKAYHSIQFYMTIHDDNRSHLAFSPENNEYNLVATSNLSLGNTKIGSYNALRVLDRPTYDFL